jgi:ATP-binding cassette subfamily F protein uup
MKSIGTPRRRRNLSKAFDGMDRHNAWDFETQYRQILFKLKLEDFHLKVKNFQVDSKSVCRRHHFNQPPWLIDSGWTYESPRFRNDWMVRNLLCKKNITLFMVTHDRFFLERVCNEIIEDNGKLYSTKETTLII